MFHRSLWLCFAIRTGQGRFCCENAGFFEWHHLRKNHTPNLSQSYFELGVGASSHKGKRVTRADFPGYISRRGTATPSSSKARRWVEVGVESNSNELALSVVTTIVLRVRVPR